MPPPTPSTKKKKTNSVFNMPPKPERVPLPDDDKYDVGAPLPRRRGRGRACCGNC
jgi:hypothetical protein